MTSECQWCINPLFMGSNLPEYLSYQGELSAGRLKRDGTTRSWRDQAYRDLQNCFDCVVCYHDALDEAFSDRYLFPAPPWEDVYLADVERLKNSLSRVLDPNNPDDELSSDIFTPFKEILRYPRYLLDKDLNSMVVDCVNQGSWLNTADLEHKVFPGIYLLLINPAQEVQRWALETVKSLDPVDYLTYDELEEVISWIMGVLNFDLFQEPLTEVLATPWDLSQPVRLPVHLFPVKSKKTFWIGLCMLIKSIDKNFVQSHLLSSTSEHKHLIDAVLHALEPQKTCGNFPNNGVSEDLGFWPALQTFSVLLEILGTFFWHCTCQHPNHVYKMILDHVELAKQIQCLAEQHEEIGEDEDEDDDDFLSNSQYVYATRIRKPHKLQYCLPTSSSSELKEDDYYPQTLALSWIQPLALSLVDCGDVAFPVLRKIIAALYSMFVIGLSPKPIVKSSHLLGLNVPSLNNSTFICKSFRKLSDIALYTLAKVVEVLFNKELYKFLLNEKAFWLPLFSSDFLVLMMTTPHLLNPKATSFNGQSGIKAVRNAIWSMIKCPAGQELPNCARLTLFFSPKLGRMHKSPLSQPLSSSMIYETLLTILTICNSKQDIAGPFLPLKPSKASDEVPLNVSSTSLVPGVLKEANFPYKAVKEEKIDCDPDFCPQNESRVEKMDCGPDFCPQNESRVDPSRRRSRLSLSSQRKSQSFCILKEKATEAYHGENEGCSSASVSNSPIAKKSLGRRKLFKTEKFDNTAISGNKDCNFALDLNDDEHSVHSNLSNSSTEDFSPVLGRNLQKNVSKTFSRKRKIAMHSRIAKTNCHSKEAEHVIVISSSSDSECDDQTKTKKSARSHISVSSLQVGTEAKKPATDLKIQSKFDCSESATSLDSNQTGAQQALPLLLQETTDHPIDLLTSEKSNSSNSIVPVGMPSHTDWFTTKFSPTSAYTFSNFVSKKSLDGSSDDTTSKRNCTLDMRDERKQSTVYQSQVNREGSDDNSIAGVNDPSGKNDEVFTVGSDDEEKWYTPPTSMKNDEEVTCKAGNEPNDMTDELFMMDSQDPYGDLLCTPLNSNNTKVLSHKSAEHVLPPSEPLEETSDDNFLVDPPVKRQRLCLPLSSESEPEVDRLCVYNKAFSLPSCASEGREVVTQPQVKPRPVKLNLDKLTPQGIDNIKEQIKQGELCCTSPFTKYRNQCDDFLQSNSQESNSSAQGIELIVSIHQSVVKPNQQAKPLAGNSAQIDQTTFASGSKSERKELVKPLCNEELFSNSQVQVGGECIIHYDGGDELPSFVCRSNESFEKGVHSDQMEVQTLDLGSHRTLPEAKATELQVTEPISFSSNENENFRVTKPPRSCVSDPTCKRRNAGVTQRPKFSRSRMVFCLDDDVKSTSPRVAESTSSNQETTGIDQSVSSPSILKSSGTQQERLLNNRTEHQRNFVKSTVTNKQSTKSKLDSLYKQILNWPVDPSILKHHFIPNCPSSAVPVSFSNYDQYFNCYSSLALLELRDTICDVNPSHHKHINAKLVCPLANDQFIRCEATVPQKDLEEYNIPFQNYLVKLDFFLEEGIDGSVTEDTHSKFGIVRSMNPVNGGRKTKHNQSMVDVSFKIQLVTTDISDLDIARVCISDVLNLTTCVRQWEALLNVRRSPLLKDILCPRGGVYFGLNSKTLNSCVERNKLLHERVYSSSQHSAIKWATERVKEEYIHPRVLLLQGPPGTGKTHTVVGMVQDILQCLTKQFNSKVSTLPGVQTQKNSPHILVCAMSNFAVDEVAIKLMKTGLVCNTPQWRDRGAKGINVVRIGDQRIHSDVKCVSVDSLVDKARDGNYPDPKSCDKELQQLKNEMEDDELKIKKLRSKKLHFSLSDIPLEHKVTKEISMLDAEIHESVNKKAEKEKKMKELNDRLKGIKMKEQNLKRKVLLNADVVFCCLGTCGRAEIRAIFKDPMHFNCVIVDEASYCSEVDVLLPISYCSSKLILIGDSAKFPAVVRSKTAESLGFGRSMLERMKTFLEEKDCQMRILQTQCRMVPALCQFPSNYFYSNKIINAEFLKEHVGKYNLHSFLVFDIEHGKDTGSGGISNPEENELVMMILEQLMEQGVGQSQIGIITPYRGQEKLIKSSLAKRLGSRKIDVGSAESFQGGEKEVIVLSCAKTSDSTKPLGFLSSTQKMIVALTRSKLALYVLGRCESLKADEDWTAFLEHAEKLGKIVHCQEVSPITARKILIPTTNDEDATSTHSSTNEEKLPTTQCEFSSRIPDPRIYPPSQKNSASRTPSPSLGVVDTTHSKITSSLSIIHESLGSLDKSTSRTSSCSTDASEQNPISTNEANEITSSKQHIETESYCTWKDHEPVCHWPDSPSIPRPELHCYSDDIDYSRNFPMPPVGVNSCHGGPKKRIAHASTEEILLCCQLAPLFRQTNLQVSSTKLPASTCQPQQK